MVVRFETQYALAGYPLSHDFRARLENAVGKIAEYLSAGELRRMSARQALRRLRKLDAAALYIALEDPHSQAILPVLKVFALLARAVRIEVIYPDLTRKRLSRVKLAGGLIDVGAASVASLWAAVLCWLELKRLLKTPRAGARGIKSNSIHYLKTNLWFGVKAGGSVGHIAGVVNEFARRGLGVTFSSSEPPSMVTADVRFQKVPPPQTYGVPSELNYYRYHRKFVGQLAKDYTKVQDRFIYHRMSVANYAGVVLSRRSTIPLILEYNGSEVWVAKHWGRALRAQALAEMAETASLRHAHLIVTVSDILRDELVSRGVEEHRIVVYPNCVDDKVFDPANFDKPQIQAFRKQFGIPPDALVATFIGTFGRWHGADVLARAIRKLAHEEAGWLERQKLRFLLVGDGDRAAEVRQILSEQACRPFVVMTGLIPQRDAPLVLAASDVVLSPHVRNADGSRFFGSPTKLFEYMAMAKGIVASELDQIGAILKGSLRVGALPEGAPEDSDNMAAVLTTPGDVQELIAGVRFLVERPDWRLWLGINARNLAVRRYTWRQHVDQILSRCTAILGRSL